MLNCISVFIGGGLGSLLRYFVSKAFAGGILGTFTVNIIGCFIIGYIFALTLNKTGFLPHNLKLFIVTGFLGGLTTFSTLNIEAFELIKCGKIFYGIFYIVASSIIGLFAAFLGYFLYSKFPY